MSFELQPRLEGELVELRPLAPRDFAAVYEAARDPLIWEQHPESDRHTPAVFQRYFDGAIASGGAFAILDRRTRRIIGSTRFCNLKPGEVEIGWTFLVRGCWGGAYNRELKALMIDHALRVVDRVVFVVGPGNLRSRRAMEKIGATLVARGPRPGPDGSVSEQVVFAITRAEWPRLRPQPARPGA